MAGGAGVRLALAAGIALRIALLLAVARAHVTLRYPPPVLKNGVFSQ
jgi:hypothetical protein